MSAPTGPTDLLHASARSIAGWIAAGVVTPLEVVDAHLDRIQAVNPALNAVVVPRYDDARAEAKAATAAMGRRATRPTLYGVPFTAKEYIAVKGMPNTGGMAPYASRRAGADATVIRRLKDAGAILLGLTNGPEGGLYMEAENVIYGRTNNPWREGRTPGGSSGGEGAIIAAGGAPFGIGSDIGGSVRIPAGFCGTFAHKATAMRVPTTGHFPNSDTLKAFLCIGPLCRKAEDLPLLMQVLSGADGVDHLTQSVTLPDPSSVDPTTLVVYRTDPEPARLSAPIRRALEQAEAALVARGARAERLPLPEATDGLMLWGATLAEDAPDERYATLLGGGTDVDVLRELPRWLARRSRHTGPALLVLALEALMGKDTTRRAAQAAALAATREKLQARLGPNAILLHPVYPTTAPRHYQALLRPLALGCTALLSACQIPVSVVPMGFDDGGLPIAIQVAAGVDQDHLCFAAAAWLEADFGGWVRAEPAKTAY